MDRSERGTVSLLLVEDDPVDRMAIERGIERGERPWTLRCATTVAEARDALREDPPDLVILDYNLPDGTGLELQAELGGLPCVFVTGGDTATLAVQAMQAGAYDYMVKDIERTYVDLLPEVIERALEDAQLREELRRHREELDNLVRERTAELEAAKSELEEEIRVGERLNQSVIASEERYRGMVETSLGLLFRLDAEGRIIYLNPEWERSLGYALEEMLGKELGSLAHPGADTSREKVWGKLKEGEAIKGLQAVLAGKGGEEVHLVVSAIPIRDETGTIVGAQGSAYDLTDHQLAMEARRTSEDRFRATFEQKAVGIVHVNPQGRIVRANDRLCEITGYSRDELLRMNVQDLTHPDDRAGSGARLEEALAGGMEQYTLEQRYIRKSGEPLWISLSVSVEKREDGTPYYLIGTVQDISARKRVEGELRDSRERLRGLAARLVEVREEERTGIARELHDELGQALTALRMDLALLEEGLGEGEPELVDRVRSMVELTDSSIDSVQTMSARLRSPILDVLGLQAAVEWQVEEFAGRTEIACEVEMPDEGLDLVEKRATGVFRILQEALTNVARHAEASRVRVRLEQTFGQVMLEVEDNGVGVSEEVLESYESLGLIGMRERAEMMEGEVKIERRPEGGSRVTLTLPSSEPEVRKGETG